MAVYWTFYLERSVYSTYYLNQSRIPNEIPTYSRAVYLLLIPGLYRAVYSLFNTLTMPGLYSQYVAKIRVLLCSIFLLDQVYVIPRRLGCINFYLFIYTYLQSDRLQVDLLCCVYTIRRSPQFAQLFKGIRTVCTTYNYTVGKFNLWLTAILYSNSSQIFCCVQ